MSTSSVSPSSCWLLTTSNSLKRQLCSIAHDARVLIAILKHPHSRWPAKVVGGCAVAYLVSPIQLIPSFIPIIGQLDDLAVLSLGIKYLRRSVSEEVLAECEQKARNWRVQQDKMLLLFLRRLRGGQRARKETDPNELK